MTNIEIVEKLIGGINPQGEANVDDTNFENLKELCSLVSDLVIKIEYVASYRGRQEFSIKRAGEYASKFLTDTLRICE